MMLPLKNSATLNDIVYRTVFFPQAYLFKKWDYAIHTVCSKTTFLIKQHVIYHFAGDQIFVVGITSTATNQICAKKVFYSCIGSP